MDAEPDLNAVYWRKLPREMVKRALEIWDHEDPIQEKKGAWWVLNGHSAAPCQSWGNPCLVSVGLMGRWAVPTAKLRGSYLLDPRNRLAVPAKVRHHFDAKPGDLFEWEIGPDGVRLHKLKVTRAPPPAPARLP